MRRRGAGADPIFDATADPIFDATAAEKISRRPAANEDFYWLRRRRRRRRRTLCRRGALVQNKVLQGQSGSISRFHTLPIFSAKFPFISQAGICYFMLKQLKSLEN